VRRVTALFEAGGWPANDSTAQWAAKITQAWRETVDGIFRVGDLLIAAKADPACRFDELDLPFERSMANKLTLIAQKQWFRRSSIWNMLPASWTTLYALSTIDDEQLDEHLAAGDIKPELEGGTVSGWRKKVRRVVRERQLTAKTIAVAAELGRKVYGVIYADPPWRFEPYSRETGMDRAADNHYQTMPIEAIKRLQAPAAGDCVLFLWATAPMLVEALDVMRAWGFTYKSQFVWVKHKAGTGYWARNRHELLLIGTRGDIPAPSPEKRYDSVIEARAGRHSAKPFLVHEMIEDMFPLLPRVEMFARATHTGWDAWGNEAEVDDAA
jgi:N6-adenosine-specific RNA methylase IME4